jgi:molybdopterin/thiamine biosynthesis adenylyltransferase
MTTENMNTDEFYRSISGLLDPRSIQTKRVAVAGLGSGGGRVAAELGRLGVNLLLVERPEERLEEHNILRHVLGYRSLGKLKMLEMLEYIRNLNPSTHVESCPLDVVEHQETLEKQLKLWRPDVIAVCTDNEPSKHAVNEVAFNLGIPQTGGAVYDRGVGGEVYRTRPGQACYGCLASHLSLERYAPRSRDDNYYNSSEASETQSICALNLDIQQIALLHCRMTLQLLLGTTWEELRVPGEVNLCVFANRVVPGTFARGWHCEFYSIARQKDCLTCGQGCAGFERDADRIVAELKKSSSSFSTICELNMANR